MNLSCAVSCQYGMICRTNCALSSAACSDSALAVSKAGNASKQTTDSGFPPESSFRVGWVTPEYGVKSALCAATGGGAEPDFTGSAERFRSAPLVSKICKILGNRRGGVRTSGL